MKLCFRFLQCFSFNAYADGYDWSFLCVYHLQVANPAALVDSMDRFWASDCGKQYQQIALSQEVFNGSYASTHFIINTFKTLLIKPSSSANEVLSGGNSFFNRGCPSGYSSTTQYVQHNRCQ